MGVALVFAFFVLIEKNLKHLNWVDLVDLEVVDLLSSHKILPIGNPKIGKFLRNVRWKLLVAESLRKLVQVNKVKRKGRNGVCSSKRRLW